MSNNNTTTSGPFPYRFGTVEFETTDDAVEGFARWLEHQTDAVIAEILAQAMTTEDGKDMIGGLYDRRPNTLHGRHDGGLYKSARSVAAAYDPDVVASPLVEELYDWGKPWYFASEAARVDFETWREGQDRIAEELDELRHGYEDSRRDWYR